jgi:hypothetical protein
VSKIKGSGTATDVEESQIEGAEAKLWPLLFLIIHGILRTSMTLPIYGNYRAYG